MDVLADFIANSRRNHLGDDAIRQSLEAQGWDSNQVSLALAGITVPVPVTEPAAPATEPAAAPQTSATLHPMIAALHHVLLWFFVLSSTAAIVAVVASLFGESVDSTTLAAFIAVVAITFTPYAVFFILYLRKLRRQPNLIPGRVWSIITICLFSLGTLGTALTLVVAAITSGPASLIVGSAFVMTLDAIVLTVYAFAAFVPSRLKLRRPILIAYLPVVAVLLGSLFLMALLRLGPSLGDETTRKNLVTTVQHIKQNAASTNRLPTATEAKSLIAGSGITYSTKTSSTYQLCAKFSLEINHTDSSSYRTSGSSATPITDSYVDASEFSRPKGDQCFTIEATDLAYPPTYSLPYAQ